MTEQGIGAGVRRKEDGRFLNGRGNYVTDMVMPGQREVAFLRSPIAHGRLGRIVKPKGLEHVVFTQADLVGVKPMAAPSTLAGYRISDQHALAHGKVRFVGEPVAMTTAATRAEAEDIAELVEAEIEDLPALVDAEAARSNSALRVHDEWPDNVALSLSLDSGFEAKAREAAVVVKREISLSRQCMVPLEGKAVL
ncbi:MAG: xanthine dehydrogenase family protein molybdopterin-binding subunit, partial [Alphaproteobacteria bacterium]|nr:xanthine dehydrogenase family protein molybdopterin-binding subunit [Alphaproteobacteria bacterium]